MSPTPLARILIVDDEAAVMRALCDTLRDKGYAAEGTASGEDALKALQGTQFDLLLTDLVMPGMNGVELLAAALKLDPHLTGVLMTGRGTIETAVTAMKAGAVDYVLKPIRLNTILPVLARAIELRRLRRENAALQEGLRQRTADLEAVNRELESFNFSVSHDLRAPLRAINGYARILEEDYAVRLDAEGRRVLGAILNGSRKMGRLVDNLLELSRLGRKPLAGGEIDMTRLVEEVLREIEPEAARRATFALGALPAAYGDAPLLKQVWINLLSNALKFTSKRERPAIEVSGSTSAAENVYCVRDNGAGFEMKHYQKLFGMFQRLHSEDEFPGTGVGLAIVQRLVAKHGGRVWAEAKVQEGAAFYFVLPQARPASATRESLAQDRRPESPEPTV